MNDEKRAGAQHRAKGRHTAKRSRRYARYKRGKAIRAMQAAKVERERQTRVGNALDDIAGTDLQCV